jgi:hypothetical protein
MRPVAPVLALLLLASPVLAQKATLKIVSPTKGATVTSPVKIEVVAKGFTLVEASTPLAEGAGHVHFFIDTKPSAVKVGTMIPLDSAAKYVHAGKAPLDSRELTLAPGKHTIWVVAANSGHLALARPKPAKVTFTVK